MSYVKNWYVRNQDAITWFVIGFLIMPTVGSLAQGNYGSASIGAFLIWINYKLRKVRMQ